MTSSATREPSRWCDSQSPSSSRRHRSGATCHPLHTQHASRVERWSEEKRPSHPPPPSRQSRRTGAICRLRQKRCAPEEDRRLERKQTTRADRRDHLRTGCRHTGRSRTSRSHWGRRDKASKDRHTRSLDNRDNRRSQSTVQASRTRGSIQIRSRANRNHPNPSLDPDLDPSPCHSTRSLCRSLRTPYRNRRSLPENRHTLR